MRRWGFAFYEGQPVPCRVQGETFSLSEPRLVEQDGSAVGYEVIRVPLHQTGHASGEYEDFLTGFRAFPMANVLGDGLWASRLPQMASLLGERRRIEPRSGGSAYNRK